MRWWQQLKQNWRALAEDQPGHRFQNRYRRAKQSRRGSIAHHLLTAVRVIGGVLALILAAIEAVFPGPAVLFLFIGGALLAGESLTIARVMDWLEMKVRRFARAARKHWRRASKVARAAVVFVAAIAAAAGAYLSFQIISE